MPTTTSIRPAATTTYAVTTRATASLHAPPQHVTPAEPSDGRGLALVCVDGLSFPAMQKAVREGRMPNLRRLLDLEGYVARPFLAGTPCTTPASMLGYAYGFNDHVPGYVWYDKPTATYKSAEDYAAFDPAFEQPAARQGGPGLYTQGRVSSNLVGGGSQDTHMVLDSMSRHYNAAGTWGAVKYLAPEVGFLLKHPIQAVKTAFAFPLEVLRAIRDDAQDESGIRTSWKEVLSYGIRHRALENVLITDVATLRVREAMKHGEPMTFVDLAGYDVAAHKHGPYSEQAQRSLERIDRRLGEIVAESRNSKHRRYEVAFLSDHGQSPGVDWQSRYGGGFYDYVNGLARTANPAETIATAYSGSLNHLYFTSDAKQWQFLDVMHQYPGLVQSLVTHPGIDFVASRQNGTTVIVGKGGMVTVASGQFTTFGRDVLSSRGKSDVLAAQIHHVAQMPNAGDLIAFGSWDGHKVVTFADGADQLGGHGGLGGDQDTPMLITEPGRKVDVSDVTNTEQMYPILRGMLPRDGQP